MSFFYVLMNQVMEMLKVVVKNAELGSVIIIWNANGFLTFLKKMDTPIQ